MPIYENGTILQLLGEAYTMELETIQNYIAASVNPDGVRSASDAFFHT
jgi:hypothetical protein